MAMSIAQRNRKLWEAIKKGDISVGDLIGDGGYLLREEENRFMLKVYDSTPFLSAIRKVDMTAPVRRINKIGITGDFLNPAPTSGTALDAAKRSKVFTEWIELTTTELIGSMYIPYDVIEDNLERGTLEATIMDKLLPPKIGRDLEKVLIQGGTAGGLLAAFDGITEIIANDSDNHNTVDFDSVSGTPTPDMFEAILEALPYAFRELQENLRFICNYAVVDKFIMNWMQRLTPGGDTMLNMDQLAQFGFRGIPFLPAARMLPENIVLSTPQNFILGTQRGIQIETARDIEARMIIIVVTMRVAVGVEQVDGCVLATGVNVSGTTTTD